MNIISGFGLKGIVSALEYTRFSVLYVVRFYRLLNAKVMHIIYVYNSERNNTIAYLRVSAPIRS